MRVNDIGRTDQVRFEAQRAAYHDVVRVCVIEPRCEAITFWGFTDAHTWLAGDRPLLFDSAYQPKPAYNHVLDALRGRQSAESRTDGWSRRLILRPIRDFREDLVRQRIGVLLEAGLKCRKPLIHIPFQRARVADVRTDERQDHHDCHDGENPAHGFIGHRFGRFGCRKASPSAFL